MFSAISHSLPSRGTTFFSFTLLLTLALTFILSSSASKPSANFLQKRSALVQGRQEPNGSSSFFSSSSNPNRSPFAPGPSTTTTTTPAAPATSANQTTNRQTATSSSAVTSTSSTSTTTSKSTSTTTSSSTTDVPTPTVVFAPTDTHPLTTLIVPTTTFTADADPTDTSTNVPDSASGNGFWGNKGAVGATFSIVGLVGLGLLIAGGTMAMRRRTRRANDGDEFLDKYPNSNHGIDNPDDNVSTHNVITPAAPDAYLDRALHYGGNSINSNASGSYSSQQNVNGNAQQSSSNQYNQMHQDANSSSQQYSSNQYNQMHQDANANSQQYSSNQIQTHQDANSNPQQYNSSQYNQMHQGDPNSIQQPQVGQVQMQHMGQIQMQHMGQNMMEHPPGLAYSPEQVQYNNQVGYGTGIGRAVASGNQQYAPPPAFRDQVGRDSYQPSIDSFYGGAYGAR